MVSYIERKNRILRTPYGLTPLNSAYQASGGGGHSDFSWYYRQCLSVNDNFLVLGETPKQHVNNVSSLTDS